jgi:hypothetical protein
MDIFTDLVAPNPLIMKTGFIQLGIILVMLAVKQLKKSNVTSGPLFWAKLNGPLTSLILCEFWALAAFAMFRASTAIDEYFVAGIWMAGGTSLLGSLLKDATDGSMGATNTEDVAKMRAKNDSHGGVGG